MSMESILAAIDQQIAELEHVRSLLEISPVTTKKRLGRPPAGASVKSLIVHAAASRKRKKRKMSAEGRARIVAAQKARWAKIRKSSKA